MSDSSALPAVLFAMDPHHLPRLFPAPVRARLASCYRMPDGAAPVPEASGGVALADAEVLITGWGCAPLTAEVLDTMPRLRAVLHSAGSVKAHVTSACWERGLLVSSAAVANALPVAEFTLGAMLLAGKDVFRIRARYAAEHRLPETGETASLGNYRRRVGIIGASRTGRRVLELLRPFDFETAVHDPRLSAPDAAALGVRRLPLDELVASSDILSVHAPDLPSTRRLLDARRLALMPDGATLINTARGALVDTDALTAELSSGRLSALLDVTDPEPLPPGSPLYGLPNVTLTPHLAGALGNELERLGAAVADEAECLRAGRPLRHRVVRADLEHSA
ncbi:hydroxyacid dehydrogenase [Streptomyces sp. N2-109]|uniref:Hydroxyacid dehydrogenase n=1 Tax=Streptomyces gossypii TaxID=2883101 RepID=A0ABT2JVX3_9ACTN|nr:hydroxyacid dehydrogenase [Streptomyces gossypii]MCT2591475.1 hydroxyacid dehydrogenase [Streptomyces gossypii]